MPKNDHASRRASALRQEGGSRPSTGGSRPSSRQSVSFSDGGSSGGSRPSSSGRRESRAGLDGRRDSHAVPPDRRESRAGAGLSDRRASRKDHGLAEPHRRESRRAHELADPLQNPHRGRRRSRDGLEGAAGRSGRRRSRDDVGEGRKGRRRSRDEMRRPKTEQSRRRSRGSRDDIKEKKPSTPVFDDNFHRARQLLRDRMKNRPHLRPPGAEPPAVGIGLDISQLPTLGRQSRAAEWESRSSRSWRCALVFKRTTPNYRRADLRLSPELRRRAGT